MASTEQFRIQHKQILTIATEIGEMAMPRVKPGSETDIKAKLNALSGVLTIHLAMEDKSLYPSMIDSANPQAQSTARSFKDQMGGIAAAVKAFTSKYPSGKHIADNSADFTGDFKAVFAALKNRISKEEIALYPLAEKL